MPEEFESVVMPKVFPTASLLCDDEVPTSVLYIEDSALNPQKLLLPPEIPKFFVPFVTPKVFPLPLIGTLVLTEVIIEEPTFCQVPMPSACNGQVLAVVK